MMELPSNLLGNWHTQSGYGDPYIAKVDSDCFTWKPNQPIDFNSLVRVEPIRKADKAHIHEILNFLPEFYPNGHLWLDEVLERIGQDDLDLLKICDARLGTIVGTLLAKRKFGRSKKICNFYIVPHFRRKKIGSKILSSYCKENFEQGIDKLYITYGASKVLGMGDFLSSLGFEKAASLKDRYRNGDTEEVFEIRS